MGTAALEESAAFANAAKDARSFLRVNGTFKTWGVRREASVACCAASGDSASVAMCYGTRRMLTQTELWEK
jgi:hypothetical protein